jgi:hypothetical protein
MLPRTSVAGPVRFLSGVKFKRLGIWPWRHYLTVQGRDRAHEKEALPLPTSDDIAALPPIKRLTAREGRFALRA